MISRRAPFVLTAALAAAAALPAFVGAQTKMTDKPFVSGGKVDIQLDGGEYEVRAAADNHVRISLTGNTGNTAVNLAITGKQASASVKNTPHSNFKAVIEVPKVSDLVVRLTGGDLNIGLITGNKDVEATAGDVRIEVGSGADYASVDAAVRIGDMSTGPFNGTKSGLLGHELKWTGKGKYTLHARLGAGDLNLK